MHSSWLSKGDNRDFGEVLYPPSLTAYAKASADQEAMEGQVGAQGGRRPALRQAVRQAHGPEQSRETQGKSHKSGDSIGRKRKNTI